MNAMRFKPGAVQPTPVPVAVVGPPDEDDYQFVASVLSGVTFWLSNVRLLIRRKDSSPGAMTTTVGVGELARRWASKCWYEIKIYHADDEDALFLDCRAAVVFTAPGWQEGARIVRALKRSGTKCRVVELPGY